MVPVASFGTQSLRTVLWSINEPRENTSSVRDAKTSRPSWTGNAGRSNEVPEFGLSDPER